MKGKHISKLDLDEKLGIIASVNRDRSVWPAQLLQWVRDTHYYADKVATETEPNSEAIVIFWIRISGLFIDVARLVEQQAQAAAKSGVHQRFLAAVHAVKATLSDDELLYAEYRRHVDSHPFQTGYEHLLPDGQVRQTFTSKVLGRTMALADVDAALDRIIRPAVLAAVAAHPWGRPPSLGESAIAVRVAKKVHVGLAQVRLEAMAYHLEMTGKPPEF